MSKSSDQAKGCIGLVLLGLIIAIVVVVVKTVGTAVIAFVYGIDRWTAGVAALFPRAFDREMGWAVLGVVLGATAGAIYSLMRKGSEIASMEAHATRAPVAVLVGFLGVGTVVALGAIASTVDPPPPPPPPPSIGTRYVASTRASLRVTPTSAASEIALLPINTRCDLLSHGSRYDGVRCDGQDGYILKDLLGDAPQDAVALLAQAHDTSRSLSDRLKLASRSSAITPREEADAIAREAFFRIEFEQGLDVVRKKREALKEVVTAQCDSAASTAVCIGFVLRTRIPLSDEWTRVGIRGRDFAAASLVGTNLDVRSGRVDRTADTVRLRIERLSSSEPLTMSEILRRGPHVRVPPSPGVVARVAPVVPATPRRPDDRPIVPPADPADANPHGRALARPDERAP